MLNHQNDLFKHIKSYRFCISISKDEKNGEKLNIGRKVSDRMGSIDLK